MNLMIKEPISNLNNSIRSAGTVGRGPHQQGDEQAQATGGE